MAYISLSSDPRRQLRKTGGFTLFEVMLASFISAIVFAGVLSAYLFLARALVREGNMESLESRTRTTLFEFTQDVSTSAGVDPSGMTISTLILHEPTLANPNNEITYSYDNTSGQLTRTPTGLGATVLLTGLSSFAFGYFDFSGLATVNPNAVKLVNISYQTVAGEAVTGTQSFFNVVSPRVMLKNKQYLQ
jgi:hypothetical protein